MPTIPVDRAGSELANDRTSILIVDDNPANLRLLHTLLDERGFDVRVATGGVSALRSVRAEAPDLILLDIEMPDLSGYDVCRELKKDSTTRDVPILFISAAKDAEAKVQSFQVGGVDYVTKPFQVDEVLARIDHQLTIHRQRRQIEAQAERLRELDAVKSRFFAGISHEFRTPLMLTRGLMQDVLDGRQGSVPRSARQALDRALLHADRLEDLIEQILELSKLEVGAVHLRRELVDVVDLLERTAAALAPLAERAGLSLVVEAGGAAHTLEADAEALTKVITNLVSNACKHTGSGGKVTLRVAEDEGEMLITVEDTGRGIPPDVLPHVFERFFKHESSPGERRPGAGIGLSLARELVQLHGGQLTVESVVGRGTTFTARLPRHLTSGDGQAAVAHPVVRLRSLEAELLAAEPAPAAEPATDDRTTVLIADDHAEVRRYVRTHLEQRYHVLEAADGRTALDVVRKHLPDLVVTDLRMPGIDGITLCRTLKQDPRTDFIPVVLLTVRTEAEARVEGLHAGADDYLAKPFNVTELMARLDNLVTQRRRLRKRLEASPDAPSPLLTPTREDLDPDEVDFLSRLTAAIEAHLDDPDFSVPDLASEMAQDRTTLYRWVQRLLGRSPSDAIRSLRLQHAAALLTARTGTVSEVAYAVGFRSVQHFTRSFREAFDATPTDFMASHASS